MTNPTGKGGFTKGVSGNPKGRPPKQRALTAILERRGATRTLDADGKQRSGKNILARAVWELVTTGVTTLRNDNKILELAVTSGEWFEIVKWLYGQIDGPPRGELDVTTAGESFNLNAWQQQRRQRLAAIEENDAD